MLEEEQRKTTKDDVNISTISNLHVKHLKELPDQHGLIVELQEEGLIPFFWDGELNLGGGPGQITRTKSFLTRRAPSWPRSG